MPSPGAIANRRFLILLLAALGLISFTLILLFPPHISSPNPNYSSTPIHPIDAQESTLKGAAIMGTLGNETLKAELGRAAWKLLHTTMARFPDAPTQDESTALFSYVHLFARLYPCGECAGHFRQILMRFPPQTNSRSSAAAWACHVHNEVNKSLGKELFDCSHIGEFYDCGCAEDGKEKEGEKKAVVNDEFRRESERVKVTLEREGLTRGG